MLSVLSCSMPNIWNTQAVLRTFFGRNNHECATHLFAFCALHRCNAALQVSQSIMLP